MVSSHDDVASMALPRAVTQHARVDLRLTGSCPAEFACQSAALGDLHDGARIGARLGSSTGCRAGSAGTEPWMSDVTVGNAPVGRRAWGTVAVVSAAGALVSLDTMVNIAFPAITESFGIEVSDIQWVVTTYVLTFASLLLAAGRLSDAFGHRRVLVTGLVLTRVRCRPVWRRARVRLVPPGASRAGGGRRTRVGFDACTGHLGRSGACAPLAPSGSSRWARRSAWPSARCSAGSCWSGPAGVRCTCCGYPLRSSCSSSSSVSFPLRQSAMATGEARASRSTFRVRCWWGPGWPPGSWR